VNFQVAQEAAQGTTMLNSSTGRSVSPDTGQGTTMQHSSTSSELRRVLVPQSPVSDLSPPGTAASALASEPLGSAEAADIHLPDESLQRLWSAQTGAHRGAETLGSTRKSMQSQRADPRPHTVPGKPASGSRNTLAGSVSLPALPSAASTLNAGGIKPTNAGGGLGATLKPRESGPQAEPYIMQVWEQHPHATQAKMQNELIRLGAVTPPECGRSTGGLRSEAKRPKQLSGSLGASLS